MQARYGCVAECRACAHRGLTAEESAARKGEWLARALAPWASRIAPIMAPSAEGRWGYRGRVTLKAEFAAGAGDDHGATATHGQARWRIGLQQRAPGARKPEVLEIPRCPVQTAAVNAAVASLKGELETRALGAAEFPLAYVVANGAFVTLVLKARRPEGDASARGFDGTVGGDWTSDCDRWLERHAWFRDWRPAGFEGVWICFHPSAGRKVFSSDWLRVSGPERARTADGFWHGPESFLQAVPALHRASLDAAEAFLAPSEGDFVVDLYCGIGISLARWTARGARTLGVEIGGSAVECAGLNAPGAEVLRGDCVNRLPQVQAAIKAWIGPDSGHNAAAQQKGRDDLLVYANPPRTGLEPEVVAWLCQDSSEARPGRIAYLSCSAGTLARDLEILTGEEGGYRVARILPYDFFPQTSHVECLALLER